MKKSFRRRLLIILLAVSLLTIFIFSNRREDDSLLVLTIENADFSEKIYLPEAMVYQKLMEMSFKDMGGEDVFKIDVLGMDPFQISAERVLASIIRVKLASHLAGNIYQNETQMLLDKTDELIKILGEDYMSCYQITREIVQKVVTENYLAHRYMENVSFRTSEFEEEIAQEVEKRFGIYDTMDVKSYLEVYVVHPMMFYTGQFAGGSWVSYPEEQKAQILARCEALLELTDVMSFRRMAAGFSDSGKTEGNPLFEVGDCKCDKMIYDNVYLGQMDPSVSSKVQDMKVGEISDIIETPYGYLVVWLDGRRACTENDISYFRNQIAAASQAYRSDVLSELKDQRMEEEWILMEEECHIERYVERYISLMNEAGETVR